MLDGWLKYIDEAYKAIELYRTENPTLYATLERHIRLESIFPRFALITLHSGMYSSDDLSAMRLEFYEDCNSFDITRLSETVTLDATFESWGL